MSVAAADVKQQSPAQAQGAGQGTGQGQGVVHTAAAVGYTNAAETYEKGRPDYPAAALQHLSGLLRDARLVVELGAGTGKFTRLLTQHLSADARLIATEPVANMRKQMLKALRAQAAAATAATAASAPAAATAPAPAAASADDSEGVVGGVEVRDGTAEHVPSVASGTADAVVVAQAFHWFDAAKARAEMQRVLRPGGVVVLIWNRRDTVTSVLGRKLDEYMDSLLPADASQPRYSQYRWQSAWRLPSDPKPKPKPNAKSNASANAAAAGSGAFAFAPLQLQSFPHAQRGVRQMVLDRTLSVSFVASLPPAARDAVQQRTNAIIDEVVARHGPATATATASAADDSELEFEIPYFTDLWISAKL